MHATDPWYALGDGTRRAVFAHVASRPSSVTAIADRLPVSRPAVSQHLRVLLDAGLVNVEKRGRQRLYRPNPAGLDHLRRELETYWTGVLASFKDIAERTYETNSGEPDD